MRGAIYLFIATLFIWLYTYVPSGVEYKLLPLSISEECVDFILMKNRAGQYDNDSQFIKRLTPDQSSLLIKNINQAENLGIRKGISWHFIDIYLKDGHVRSYNINGSRYVMDKNNYCYDLGNMELVESIWQYHVPDSSDYVELDIEN